MMRLDEYQRSVVESAPNDSLRVIGAPGSGKTGCLANRYVHLYTKHNFSPKRILLLTYSKKGTQEMVRRIRDIIDLDYRDRKNISTIHAFCYRLYNDRLIANKMKPLRVWEYGDPETNPSYIAADLMQKYKIPSDLSLFDSINKTFKSVPDPNPDLLVNTGANVVFAKRAFEMWKEYQSWMDNNSLTDFHGQVWNVDKLMHDNRFFASMIAQRFDKVICDEGQDIFPQTYRLLLKLSAESSLEVYYDPSQSIYGFNGAAPHLVDRVENDLPHIKTIHLANNYRSERNIVEVVNEFGPATTPTFHKMNCVKADFPGSVHIHEANTVPDQADIIAEQITLNNYEPRDTYVLARTNAQCSVLYQRLIELGVPAFYPGKFTIWDRSHIRAAISYFAIVKGEDGPEDLDNILNIPSEDYTNVFGQNRGKYTPTRFLPRRVFKTKSFTDLVKGSVNLSNAQRPGVSNIIKFIDYLRDLDTDRSRVAEIQGAISKWVQWTGGDYMSAEEDLAMIWDKLENLDYSVNSLRLHVRKVKEAQRKAKRGANLVQVMTIHQAKGLEAITVFLTGLSEPAESPRDTHGFHPGRNTNPDINEENCLFYTGISRAMKNLHLSYYLKSGETHYNLSSFVTDFTRQKARENNLDTI